METERTQGELAFIDQMTRKRLVDWCDRVARGLPLDLLEEGAPSPGSIKAFRISPYAEHAIAKKWLSVNGSHILAAGWDTAARFLKR
jgi:hypothetical protein